MKKLVFVFISLAILNTADAQVKALTETGREVILYKDGTWKYTQDSTGAAESSAAVLKLNPVTFSKPAASTFLVKSKVVNIGVYINPGKWTFSPSRNEEEASEYTFKMKSGDGYAMLLTEKTEIDLEEMKQIALINAKEAAPDAKVESAEYRMVNNIKVLCMKITGTIHGIKFKYFGYYYSNANGTIQLISYAGQKLLDQSYKEFEEFLNGFVLAEK